MAERWADAVHPSVSCGCRFDQGPIRSRAGKDHLEIGYLLLHEFTRPYQERHAFLSVHTAYVETQSSPVRRRAAFSAARSFSVTAAAAVVSARVSIAFSTDGRSAG